MSALHPEIDLLRAALQPLCSRCFSRQLAEAYAYIDRLCLHLCFHLAHECALLNNASESLADVRRGIGIAPDANYLLNTVFEILREEGFAERTANGWRRRQRFPRDASTELQREALAACPQAQATFELIQRCHDHARAFLTGREPGLATIFHRGDVGLWERLHTVDGVMSIYADLIPPALEAILGRKICLLEIGAGTGAVLRRCQPFLRERATEAYWFTDISPLLVQRARARYGADGFMQFATLDLNRPLVSQGLTGESFDAVIGVNVLHVARELAFTLRELRSVLKSPGWLIAAEGSPPDAQRRWRLDLVFAFLPGWWNVALDPVLRPRPGFLLPAEWIRALRACGYQPVRVLPGEGWFGGPCRGGLIIAGKGT
jgi:microcystin synthetase protein McyE